MIELTYLEGYCLRSIVADSLVDALHVRAALRARGLRVRVWIGDRLMGVR